MLMDIVRKRTNLTVTPDQKEGIKILRNILRKWLSLTIAIAFAINIFAPTPPANTDALRVTSLGNTPDRVKAGIASEFIKASSAGYRDKNKKLVEDILDPAKPYYGYDIILIVTTEEEERKAVEQEFDAVFGTGRTNQTNGIAKVIAVTIDNSNRGQLIDAGYGLQKAIDEMGENGVNFVEELNNGNKTICAILDAGMGKRGGNLTLSENGSRGTVHIGGKLKNGTAMTTLIKGAATSALFAKSGKGYMDVFYTASQAVIPDADVTAETEPGNVRGCIIKFAQDVNDASGVTQKTVENFGVYEIDGKTDKVRSHPKWTWSRQDEAKPFAKTNVTVEKGLANYQAARERGDRWGFSLGSHRVNIKFELALLKFLKETNRLYDKNCPKLEPPTLILPVLTYRELEEQNPGQSVNRADVLTNIKGDISLESANLALDFYEWYYEWYAGKYGTPEHFLGLSGIGSDLYWWVYRESFGILNNSLLMLSDLSGNKIQVDNQGKKHEEAAEEADIKEAIALRELHNITAPIMRSTLGGIYVNEKGEYTEDGVEKQVTVEAMREGVTIGGVKVKGSILVDSNLCEGCEIYDSFVEDTTATEKLLLDYSYAARNNITYAQVRGVFLYNVMGRLDEVAEGVSCVDVFRKDLQGNLRDERFPEGQTRLFQEFDADISKQFSKPGDPYPEPLPGNKFSYQEIADLNVAGATEVRNRIAKSFMPKSSSAGTLKGAIFDLDGVVSSLTELIGLMDSTRQIIEGQEREGLLKEKISDIQSNEYFVEGRIAYIPNRGGRLFVVGDTHGDYMSVEQILRQSEFIERIERGENPHMVFLGDYIDDGGDSIKNLRLMLGLKKQYPDNVTLLRGNHDFIDESYKERLISQRYGYVPENWLIDKIKGYPQEQQESFLRSFRELTEKLPVLACTANGIVLAHSGIPALEREENKNRCSDGLLSISSRQPLVADSKQDNIAIQWEVLWTMVEYTEPETGDRPWTYPKGEPSLFKYWVGERSFEHFMKAIGGKIMIRGHDRNAKRDATLFGSRFITVISTGKQSQASGQGYKYITARYGVFDLSREYERINPEQSIIDVRGYTGEEETTTEGATTIRSSSAGSYQPEILTITEDLTQFNVSFTQTEASVLDMNLLLSTIQAYQDAIERLSTLKGKSKEAVVAVAEPLNTAEASLGLMTLSKDIAAEETKIAEKARIIATIGTIIINDAEIPANQEILLTLLDKESGYLKALEEKLGCKVRLLSQFNPDTDTSANMIAISGTKLDSIPNLRYINIKAVAEDMYLPLEQVIVFAKGLLVYGIDKSATTKTAISNIYRLLTKTPIQKELLDEFLKPNGVFMLSLPAPTPINEKHYQDLHRQAMAALIAA